jgi:hypothetical protein
MRMKLRIRTAAWRSVVGVLAACATATQTPAALNQAQAMYAALQAQHADVRIEGDMIRSRASIDTAQTAVTTGQSQLFADAIADVALRTVQTARAHYDRSAAQEAADSVQKLRLTKELELSKARQAELQRENAAATARADSLERANARADSLARATARADSLARASGGADSLARPGVPPAGSVGSAQPDTTHLPPRQP